MAKKTTGLDSLNTFTQADKPKETAGGFDPESSRTSKENKAFIKHSSIYLQKSIHNKVMHAIRDDEVTLSDVVEKLLLEWLEKRA